MDRVRFGADGIRGVWGRWPFELPVLFGIGQALGQYVAMRSSSPVVVVGRDTRTSGPAIATCLMTGLLGQGVNVIYLEVMPTPGVAYLTRRQGADMGLVVTASHSPGHMNGIKLVAASGLRLEREDEMTIENLIEQAVKTPVPNKEELGHMTYGFNLFRTYTWEHKENCPSDVLRGLRLVLDCANGAASRVAPQVIRELGAEVIVINASLEGDLIGVSSGTEYMRQNPGILAEIVRKNDAQYGFSFDGDGDRLVVVDPQGNLFDGHDLVYLLARHYQKRGELRGNTVVVNNQVNKGLIPALQEVGINAIETPNGDRHLEAALYRHGLTLGGEPGGNIIINDGFHTAADATYTAILVGQALNEESDQPLFERVAPLRQFLDAYPQVTRAVRVPTKISQVELEGLNAFAGQKVDLIGRGCQASVRYSSTDPELIRVTLNGDRKDLREDMEEAAEEIRDRVVSTANHRGEWNG